MRRLLPSLASSCRVASSVQASSMRYVTVIGVCGGIGSGKSARSEYIQRTLHSKAAADAVRAAYTAASTTEGQRCPVGQLYVPVEFALPAQATSKPATVIVESCVLQRKEDVEQLETVLHVSNKQAAATPEYCTYISADRVGHEVLRDDLEAYSGRVFTSKTLRQELMEAFGPSIFVPAPTSKDSKATAVDRGQLGRLVFQSAGPVKPPLTPGGAPTMPTVGSTAPSNNPALTKLNEIMWPRIFRRIESSVRRAPPSTAFVVVEAALLTEMSSLLSLCDAVMLLDVAPSVAVSRVLMRRKDTSVAPTQAENDDAVARVSAQPTTASRTELIKQQLVVSGRGPKALVVVPTPSDIPLEEGLRRILMPTGALLQALQPTP